jgi:hypothetical protein
MEMKQIKSIINPLKPTNMEKVYLVYYDNGMSYEDHHVHVSMIFASRQSADKYAEEQNAPMKEYKASVTREEYISKNMAEEIGYSYDEFIQWEQLDWSIHRDARYYVSEEDVHP